MKRPLLTLLVLLTAGLAATAQVHVKRDTTAATAEKAYLIDPIVVTAAGHHERQSAAATPIRVITANEIQQQGLTTFEDVVTRMLPQVSSAPNAMGSQIRLGGLSNKYIVILINGRRLHGDISDNNELTRINMSRVKRIEVLDGAASTLYGSDAIAGVINLIMDYPTDAPLAMENSLRVSGEGKLTETLDIDICQGPFASYTTLTWDKADSYRINPLEYTDDEQTQTQQSIAPLYTGYKSRLFTQRFSYKVSPRFALNANLETSYKITDRPDTRDDITGGTSYEMQYKGARYALGGIYKFNARNSLQADFTADDFKYGKKYDVATSSYPYGYYSPSKEQHAYDTELKAILGLCRGGTTVAGGQWRNEFLNTATGEVDAHAYTLAAYLQHEQRLLPGLELTLALRYTYHEYFNGHLSPKAALHYAPGRFHFRASYANAFRSPGMDELFYHYFSLNRGKAQISFGNQDLSPEQSNYFSLNAEYAAPRWSVGLTGYLNFIADMIEKQSVAVDDAARQMLQDEFPDLTAAQAEALTQYSLYQNADKGEVKGLQAYATVSPCSCLTLRLNYAYTYARSRSEGTWALVDRSIKNTLTLSADFHRQWTGYALSVNVNARFQSKTYYSSYENAPGHALWNINTTHTFSRLVPHLLLQPSIGVDNIFDKVDNRIDSDLRKYALYSPGRRLTLALKVRFE